MDMPAGEGMPVLAVGGDDGVLRSERLHDADRAGLFPDAQVEEPSDLRGAVELDASFLETANSEHLGEEVASELHVEVAGRPWRAHVAASSVDVSPSGRPELALL